MSRFFRYLRLVEAGTVGEQNVTVYTNIHIYIYIYIYKVMYMNTNTSMSNLDQLTKLSESTHSHTDRRHMIEYT